MKTYFSIFVLLGFVIAGIAQDEPRAHIPYKIPDGTPPPPAKPGPVRVLPEADVVTEKTYIEGGRRITVRQIQPVLLPEPPEPPAPTVMTDEFREQLAQQREKLPRPKSLMLGATIYRLPNGTTRTFVRVWGLGRNEPVSFWSSGDFSLISGIGGFIDNQGQSRLLSMTWSIHDSKQIAQRFEQTGRTYRAPVTPNLPTDRAAYVVHEGNPDDDLLLALDSLHEILNHDEAELRRAYEGRQRAAKEREEYLKANPPQPKDITLDFWRIEKPANERKGGTR
jgi:hypothetical protein